MSARIKISQAGLSAGVAGRSRTDGLATGALVTLEDVSGTGLSTFHLLWVPVEDTAAEASLAVTGDPDIWTFSPMAAAYGSYQIELRVDGVPVERRIFGIRTPANHLLIPALNERASRHAALDNDGADQIEACEQNANDFPLSVLNSFRYAGWWRSLYELYRVVEFGIGSIADHALALVKLVTVPAKSVLANATNATGDVTALAGSAGFQYLRVNSANNGLEWATLSAHASTSLVYDGGTNTFQRAALTGAITSSQNSNATSLGAVGSTSIIVSATDIQRAGLTGAITSSQNSNATAFGTAAAKSVLVNATNATAVPAFLAGTGAFQYLRVNSANTGLEWAVLPSLIVVNRATVNSATNATTVLDCTGSFSIPANTLVAGSSYRVKFSYQFLRGATATALNLGAFMDVGASSISVVAAPASTVNGFVGYVECEAIFTVLTTGVSGTAFAYLRASSNASAGNAFTWVATNTNPFAIDTTIANTIKGSGQMSAAVANCTINSTGGYVEKVQ